MVWNRNTEGKIVDRFRFHIDEKEYDLPVRIIKTGGKEDHHRAGYKPETIRVEFGIAIPNGKGEIVKDLRGTDIEALRAAAKRELGDLYAVEWEDYYLIEIEEQRDRYLFHTDGGDGMEFSWKTIQVGKAHDGRTLHQTNGLIVDGLPKTGSIRGSVFSLVKATPHAKAALKEFARRMRALRETIETFLGPKHVAETLSKAAAVARLLPAPASAKGKKRARRKG